MISALSARWPIRSCVMKDGGPGRTGRGGGPVRQSARTLYPSSAERPSARQAERRGRRRADDPDHPGSEGVVSGPPRAFAKNGRPDQKPSTASLSPCGKDRRWASWANPGRARPPSPWRFSASGRFKRPHRLSRPSLAGTDAKGAASRFAARMQMVFQDPYGSLSPRRTVGQTIGEGLSPSPSGIRRQGTVRRRSNKPCGRSAWTAPRPTAFPPTNFPAGSANASPWRGPCAETESDRPRRTDLGPRRFRPGADRLLLRDLQARHRLAYVFISHDLRVVRALADSLLVMKDGKVVEAGPRRSSVRRPRNQLPPGIDGGGLRLGSRPAWARGLMIGLFDSGFGGLDGLADGGRRPPRSPSGFSR